MSHIFDCFYLVDKSRTQATGGKGIGLAVAKEIVELHGGSIYVTSEVRSGTTFTIELPINIITTKELEDDTIGNSCINKKRCRNLLSTSR